MQPKLKWTVHGSRDFAQTHVGQLYLSICDVAPHDAERREWRGYSHLSDTSDGAPAIDVIQDLELQAVDIVDAMAACEERAREALIEEDGGLVR